MNLKLRLQCLTISLIYIISYSYEALGESLQPNAVPLPLDLQAAMDLGEKNFISVKIAQNDYETRDSQYKLSFFHFGPALESRAETAWYPKNLTNKLNTNETERESSISLTVTQPISNIWKNFYKIKELSAKKEAALSAYKTERIRARIEAAQAFLDAQQAFNDLENKKTEFETANLQFKDTSILYETGDSNKDKVDLLLSQANLKKVQIDLENSKNSYLNKLANLNKTLNINNNVTIKIKENTSTFLEKENFSLKELPILLNESKSTRSDINRIRQNIAASTAEISQDTFKYFPEFSAFSKFTNTESFSSESNLLRSETKTSNNSYNNSFSFGISMSWTIWDSGLSLVNRKELISKQYSNKLEYENMASNSTEEVTIAYNNLKNSLALLPQAKELVDLYTESYKLSQIKYKTGNINASDLIKLQYDLTNSRITLSKLRADIDHFWLKLQAAVGYIPSYSNKRLMK